MSSLLAPTMLAYYASNGCSSREERIEDALLACEDEQEFLDLAFAALDQAGVSAEMQIRIRALLESER